MINSNLRHVCFNAQKVLPLVYDESLSYYEQLCKLTHSMNKLIDVVNNTIDDTIKEFVDKQFNNIMLNTMYDSESETLTLYLDKTKGV